MLPKMLDDMLKLFVDPYFKPKKVQDPNRENLFELIYSPGNTMYSKEKVNQRRQITWDHLYLTDEETKAFIAERFSTNSIKISKLRAHKQSIKTPRDKKRSATVREESYSVKPVHNEQSHLQSAYEFSIVDSKARLNKFSNPKEVIEDLFGSKLSKTETKFPKIRNPSEDRIRHKFINKQLSNQNEYRIVLQIFRRSKTLLKKSKKTLKTQNENIKIEEQLNFLTKFNLDVRQRNKAKILKVQKSRNKKTHKKVKKKSTIFTSFYL